MNYQVQTPVSIPAYPRPLSLSDARAALPPEEFRQRLRQHLLDHPDLTLRDVARELGVTRQRAGALVGRLDRPTCAQPGPRPAPKREQAARGLAELAERVRVGDSAEQAARELDLSLPAAMKLGFRTKAVRPPHGTQARVEAGCPCWRCRRAAGVALPRGPRASAEQRAAVENWLAWVDPETGRGLSQTEIGRLVGIGQGAVSRIARAAGAE
jgi:hypothetical protein